MEQNERDELWELLGKARPTEVPPFFSRNVVRAIREGRAERAGVSGWVGSLVSLCRPRVVALAAALVLVGGFSFYHWSPGVSPGNRPASTDQDLFLAELDGDILLINDPDFLVACVETAAWTQGYSF